MPLLPLLLLLFSSASSPRATALLLLSCVPLFHLPTAFGAVVRRPVVPPLLVVDGIRGVVETPLEGGGSVQQGHAIHSRRWRQRVEHLCQPRQWEVHKGGQQRWVEGTKDVEEGPKIRPKADASTRRVGLGGRRAAGGGECVVVMPAMNFGGGGGGEGGGRRREVRRRRKRGKQKGRPKGRRRRRGRRWEHRRRGRRRRRRRRQERGKGKNGRRPARTRRRFHRGGASKRPTTSAEHTGVRGGWRGRKGGGGGTGGKHISTPFATAHKRVGLPCRLAGPAPTAEGASPGRPPGRGGHVIGKELRQGGRRRCRSLFLSSFFLPISPATSAASTGGTRRTSREGRRPWEGRAGGPPSPSPTPVLPVLLLQLLPLKPKEPPTTRGQARQREARSEGRRRAPVGCRRMLCGGQPRHRRRGPRPDFARPRRLLRSRTRRSPRAFSQRSFRGTPKHRRRRLTPAVCLGAHSPAFHARHQRATQGEYLLQGCHPSASLSLGGAALTTRPAEVLSRHSSIPSTEPTPSMSIPIGDVHHRGGASCGEGERAAQWRPGRGHRASPPTTTALWGGGRRGPRGRGKRRGRRGRRGPSAAASFASSSSSRPAFFFPDANGRGGQGETSRRGEGGGAMTTGMTLSSAAATCEEPKKGKTCPTLSSSSASGIALRSKQRTTHIREWRTPPRQRRRRERRRRRGAPSPLLPRVPPSPAASHPHPCLPLHRLLLRPPTGERRQRKR